MTLNVEPYPCACGKPVDVGVLWLANGESIYYCLDCLFSTLMQRYALDAKALVENDKADPNAIRRVQGRT